MQRCRLSVVAQVHVGVALDQPLGERHQTLGRRPVQGRVADEAERAALATVAKQARLGSEQRLHCVHIAALGRVEPRLAVRLEQRWVVVRVGCRHPAFRTAERERLTRELCKFQAGFLSPL